MAVTRAALVDLVAAADRRAGRTIAFANGCFDLLHVGHVRYLQAAAAEADRLIVAINDDAVASLERAGAADHEGGGPRGDGRRAARRRLRHRLSRSDGHAAAGAAAADVHCKGTDYTADTVPERDGARLRRARRHRRRSEGAPTRALLSRLRGRGGHG